MIKYLVLLFNLAGIIIMSLFGGIVTLTMDAPNEVKAGTDFNIEITINKSEIGGFARFQQDLPAGFTAEAIESGGSDFSFEFQKAKFFWLVLPKEEEIKIKYNVKIDPSVSGEFTISGLFAYIDGEKQTAELDPFVIKVLPADDVADNSNNENVTQELNNSISIKRQDPIVWDNGDIIINIKVNKGNLPPDQFAKIQESVPPGYNAVSMETKGAIFTYKNNSVKFLWMNLPQEQEFVVTYKLTPEAGTNTKDLALDGSFSYIKDGVTQNIDINNTTEQLADNSNNPDKNNAGNNSNNDVNKTVSYKVQVAAGHKKLKNIKSYFRKLMVKEKIALEMHEGWRKYTVGKHSIYKDARDHRVNIWNKTKVDDAFVSAYNNGQRITVQEAIMIANQKWYQ